MNNGDSFETELRRVRPATPPADFLARLQAARPVPDRPIAERTVPATLDFWRLFLRFLVPAAALVAIGGIVWRAALPLSPVTAPPTGKAAPLAAVPALKANNVQIDRELVSSFDAVARLPGGEPVRFRCREWVDEVVWQDKGQGVIVQQRAPRIEIVPVRFETY